MIGIERTNIALECECCGEIFRISYYHRAGEFKTPTDLFHRACLDRHERVGR